MKLVLEMLHILLHTECLHVLMNYSRVCFIQLQFWNKRLILKTWNSRTFFSFHKHKFHQFPVFNSSMHYMLQHVVPIPVNLKYVSQFSDEPASMYTRALLTVIFAGKLLETWIMTLPIFQKVDFIHKTKPGVIFARVVVFGWNEASCSVANDAIRTEEECKNCSILLETINFIW